MTFTDQWVLAAHALGAPVFLGSLPGPIIKSRLFPETKIFPFWPERQGHIFFHWAKLHPTELHCILLSYAAPLHSLELRCILLSYAAPY